MILLQYRFPDTQELAYSFIVATEKTILNSPVLADIGKKEETFLEMNINQKLVGTNEEGNYMIRMSTQPIRRILNGEEETLSAPAQFVDFVMSPFGEMLWVSVPLPVNQPSYPNYPLEIGDTWIYNTQFISPLSPTPMEYTLYYELQGMELVNNVNCARIAMSSGEQTFPLMNNMQQKLLLEGLNFFDVKKGCLIRSEVMVEQELLTPLERISEVTRTVVEILSDKRISVTG